MLGVMNPDWLRTLARYNRWMNDKLYERAATLSDEVRKRDSGAFFKSIHGTLNHLLLADRVWLARFTGVAVAKGNLGPGEIRSLDQELYEDFGELRAARTRTDEELEHWISGVTYERLTQPLAYHRRGRQEAQPLWWSVVHLFNHQTHHRGQVTTLLMQYGCDPGVTDLLAMLREEQA